MEKKTKGLATFNTENETTEVVNLMFMSFVYQYFFMTGKYKNLKEDFKNANKEVFKLNTNLKGEVIKDANFRAYSKVVKGMMTDVDVLGNRMNKVLNMWNGQLMDQNVTFKVYAEKEYDKVMTFSNLMLLLGIDDFLEFVKRKNSLPSDELLLEMRIAIQNISNQNIEQEGEVIKRS